MADTPSYDRRTILGALTATGVIGAAGCAELLTSDDTSTGTEDGTGEERTEEAGDGTQGGENGTGGTDETGDPDGEASGETFDIETVTSGLSNPWGLAFLPGGTELLVTERPGGLLVLDVETGETERLSGLPDVAAAGQGGLLDVTVHPDFPEQSWVYLTYAATNDAGESTTLLGRGRLDRDESTLTGFEQLHAAEPFVDSTGHFGSRVVFGTDGAVYFTTGDRQFKNFGPDHVSQDTTNELGATLRLRADGSVPEDNPFVEDSEVADSIFTYGHRNAQGMTVHPETGEIWQSEHGEEDGDVINIVRAGQNHGWPITHYGCEYGTNTPVGPDPDERDDIANPVYYWECGSGGFPPAGMTFYDGSAFPDWQGDLFVGNLAGQYLGRFTVEDPEATSPTVEECDPLLAGNGWRIRDVAVAPETGYLYVAVDASDAPIVRLTPV